MMPLHVTTLAVTGGERQRRWQLSNHFTTDPEANGLASVPEGHVCLGIRLFILISSAERPRLLLLVLRRLLVSVQRRVHASTAHGALREGLAGGPQIRVALVHVGVHRVGAFRLLCRLGQPGLHGSWCSSWC